MAYYEGRDVALFRDTGAADSSSLLSWLEANGPKTFLAIGYIRHATQGSITLANTGPYQRELHGAMQVFAHNGNLHDLAAPCPCHNQLFQPVGETDSERAFCLLLEAIKKLYGDSAKCPALAARMDVVADVASRLRDRGPASFLYADGDVLFVHADRRLQPSTGRISAPALFRLDCPGTEGTRLLRDCRTPDVPTSQQMVQFASVPLTDEDWIPLPQGMVNAVRQGETVATVQL